MTWVGTVGGDTGPARDGRWHMDTGLEKQAGLWGEHSDAEGKDVQLWVL